MDYFITGYFKESVIVVLSILVILLFMLLMFEFMKSNRRKNGIQRSASRPENEVVIKASMAKSNLRNRNKELILPTMDFEIKKGDFIYIIGKSGAGKTVLLKILGGYNKKVTNHIKFYDNSINRFTTWVRDNKKLKKIIGYVPQKDLLYLELTPKRMLEDCLVLFRNDKAEMNGILENLDMDYKKLLNSKINFLSDGERKRISIAMEMIKSPQILLLDEPDSGLDPENRERIYEMLYKINSDKKITVIISTHHQDIVNYESDEQIFLFNESGSDVRMYRKNGKIGTIGAGNRKQPEVEYMAITESQDEEGETNKIVDINTEGISNLFK